MKKKFGFPALVISGVIGVLVCALVVFLFITIKLGGNPERFSSAAKFAAVYSTIENNYIGEADMESVSDAAYTAMIDALGDRWSYFMTAGTYEAYLQYQSNSYTGIGVTIQQIDGEKYISVAGVTQDSPADRAGVDIGDKIISIAGVSMEGKTTTEAKAQVAAQKGEPFELELLKASGENETVTISTDIVVTDPVEFGFVGDGMGYVKIKNFEDGSGAGTVNAVDELISQGASSIVFDVRNNPGGKLSELLTALDHLLPEGEVFVNVDAAGEESVRYSDAECVEIPMVVLVNENSYSAAEFFAEALSEYGVAQVVGSHTTGKSRSQVTIVLADGSAIHLSTNGYLTPQRKDLAELGGITPDTELDLSDEDAAYLAAGKLDYAEDEQLQAAINELLNSAQK